MDTAFLDETRNNNKLRSKDWHFGVMWTALFYSQTSISQFMQEVVLRGLASKLCVTALIKRP